MKHYKIGFLALGLFAMASCGSEEPTDNPEIGTIDTTATVDTNNDNTEEVVVFYQVPTPDELFGFIRSAGNEPALDVLNDPANVENYIDNKAKALNFGIYSTDLAYASSYENQGPEVIKYYSSVKRLGDDLGISSAFSGAMVERIEHNLDQGDSLLNISKETYYNAYDYLEQNERGEVLALVIAGGWIESMFIVTNLVDGYSADNPTIDRMAEQKLALENLLMFLGKYEEDESVSSTIADLNELKTLFDGLQEVEVQSDAAEGGRPTLGGAPKKLTFTEEQYNQLSEKVVALRNDITS